MREQTNITQIPHAQWTSIILLMADNSLLHILPIIVISILDLFFEIFTFENEEGRGRTLAD
jgi:hypothetical protein